MFYKVTLLAALALGSGLVRAVPTPRANYVGEATWFHPGLGACGVTNTDSDFIVAVSAAVFNSSPVCGRQLTATTSDGKSVTLTVEDRCAGCAPDDLDMSPAAFGALADLSVGRVQVSWEL